MIAHIEEDPVKSTVKIYLWADGPTGERAFTWPVEVNAAGYWTWKTEYAEAEGIASEPPRPAFEMSWPIWEAFKAALLHSMGLTQDAGKLLTETLKREQARVDVLISALISPPAQTQTFDLMSGTVKEGFGG